MSSTRWCADRMTASRQVQKGLASRSFDPGVFNKGYEFMLQNFTRIYLDALAQSNGA